FPAPLHFPSRVRVRGEIIAWNPATLGGRLRVTVLELSSGVLTAEIGLGFSLHEQAEARSRPPIAASPSPPATDRPAVLVAGAAGGLGPELARALLRNHRTLAAYNRTPLPDDLRADPNVQPLALNFAEPTWPEAAAEALGVGPLYAIVHCAWPGMPRGGLLQLPPDTVHAQLSYGTLHLIRLAKLLARHAGPDGGRLVALGSVAGSMKPVLNLATYSLAKAAMEHTVCLLAAELASKRITVNAVCPSFVPAGMNRQADKRRQQLEAAQIPLGRLCQ